MRRLKSGCLGLTLLWALAAGVGRAHAQRTDGLAQVFAAIRAGQLQVVDLTHPLDDRSPYWPEGVSESPFHATVVATIDRQGYFARSLTLPEHFGTHLDAPAHFDAKGLTVDRIPPACLLSKAVVVDVSRAVQSDPDYRVTVADLESWEKAHGAVPREAIVFFRTGWGARWPSQRDYMNQDARGVLHFPGLSVEAARYLLEHAHPVAIGIDTASIDYGPSKNFEAHHVTMSAGLYHLENVANLDQLPPRGACVVALPLMLRDGSGSPTRVVALYDQKSGVRSRKSE